MNETMPQEFRQSVEQFNTRQFYACHDTLEALWIEATEPDKSFYQGILQIAVALYHLGNRNWRGAVILLGEGSNRLRKYPSSYGNINVAEFLNESWALLATLQQISPEQIAMSDVDEVEMFALPKILLVDDESETLK
jgi:predicted metal-dependent hydrolase